MRSYAINITPVQQGTGSTGINPISFRTQDAYIGVDNYSALRLDLDIYQTWYHQPIGNSHIKIWGVDLKSIGKNANLNPYKPSGTNGYKYASIDISVGMSKGLPYAQPSQFKQIVKGSILQAFSTWQGTEVGLDLVLVPSSTNPNAPTNITVQWDKGQEMTQAVKKTLELAYKGTNVYGSFSSGLTLPEGAKGQFTSLITFARKMNELSRIINKNPLYSGACITNTTQGFLLSDSELSKTGTKTIEFTDVIGNLTWIDIATIQARVTMRGDLNVGDYIRFQQYIPVNNTINNGSQFRDNLSFDGTFMVNKLHHIGSSRQPNGDSWVTVIDAVMPGINF